MHGLELNEVFRCSLHVVFFFFVALDSNIVIGWGYFSYAHRVRPCCALRVVFGTKLIEELGTDWPTG